MSDFKVNSITDRSGTSGPVLAGVSTNASSGCMIIPKGPTEHRGGRGRGILGPGAAIPGPAVFTTQNYIEIATTGNAQDFGDLSYGNAYRGGSASSTRGVFVNGQNDQTTDYVTISSKGGGNDFGEITTENMGGATFNSSTIGFRAGGSDGGVSTSTIIGFRIAQVSSFYNFGDLIEAGTYMNGASSHTRGIIFGGVTPSDSPAVTNNVIQYVTMTSMGSAQNFGDLATARKYADTTSNSVRALAGGGQATPAANTNSIEYVTIATIGNATDFGDLTSATALGKSGSVSTATRGIFAGFYPAKVNGIDYVTIMSTGNSIDFGDLTDAIAYVGGCSDSNGGLGE
tara:strand:+ start:27 stop:1055 length:1029 start_codon:yes stop_codon:yes gene_type:complete